MPVQGPQQPGFFLPGAEYFSLAPNTHIAISGRRRRVLAGTGFSTVPPDGDGEIQNVLTIEDPWPPNSGVYVEDVWATFFPQDAGGELTIQSSQLGLQLGRGTAASPIYQFGLPIATQLSPLGAQALIRDQQKLINTSDMFLLTQQAGLPTTNALQFSFEGWVHNNDPTNPHGWAVTAFIVYHLLYGFQE